MAGEGQSVNGPIVISVWVFHMIPQADGGQLVQVSSKERKTTTVTEQNDLSAAKLARFLGEVMEISVVTLSDHFCSS